MERWLLSSASGFAVTPFPGACFCRHAPEDRRALVLLAHSRLVVEGFSRQVEDLKPRHRHAQP
jgi:hypothetical protein